MNIINELNFADLLISKDSYNFRFLEGQPYPICNVPDNYNAEVQEMVQELECIRKAKGNEFFYLHLGVPYRVAVVQTISGSGFFLRKLKLPVPSLDSLGFSEPFLNTLKLMGKKRGLLLVSGATGSGKSTTIYALLTYYVQKYGDIAISIEDPPEVPVQGNYGDNQEGVWFQMDARELGGYENAMISAMRYNPRYIFLGEIRSAKTAKEAIRAAVNGHLVVSTIHGSSVQGAIYALQQIASAEGEADLVRSIIADGLLGIVHQELRFTENGQRSLSANILCNDGSASISSKIRSGKLELLSSEIEQQRIMLSHGKNLIS
ncbi:bundle-forming pilus retraction ATPase [Escherichia albertii]|nr:bundle-forming pilus retraction ATPase [Escherichia albertii]EEW7342237.1 bundle-forming pilus retraction ATPase [Escherichia albertii]